MLGRGERGISGEREGYQGRGSDIRGEGGISGEREGNQGMVLDSRPRTYSNDCSVQFIAVSLASSVCIAASL